MQSLYYAKNPQPEPPTGLTKLCSDVQLFWETWILPPDPTPEQKIARELSKLRNEKEVVMNEVDDLRMDLRIQTKLLKQYERERDHSGIERSVREQVRMEKRERFLVRQIEKANKCLEEATTIKSDHQQTLSLLIIMNATMKKSVGIPEATRITKAYSQQKMNNDKIRDMVETALGLDLEEDEDEEFTEADQQRVDELIKLSKDIGDQNIMNALPVVSGIPQKDMSGMENMTKRELEIQCGLDEKKLENYLMGIR